MLKFYDNYILYYQHIQKKIRKQRNNLLINKKNKKDYLLSLYPASACCDISSPRSSSSSFTFNPTV